MFPHFFGFDITAALPWFLMGFLLSACILGLWNFLSGSGSRPSEPTKLVAPDVGLTGQLAELQEHLAETQADLELARTSAMEIANDKVRIEAGLKSGMTLASPAQKDPGLLEQLAELQADLATAKASAVQYANEKSKLDVELRKALEAAAQRLPAPTATPLPVSASPALDAQHGLDIRRRNEIADLNAELWALRRSDVAQAEKLSALGLEITRLKDQLSAPSPADLEVKRLTAEAGKLKFKIDAQTTELSNKSGFIAMRDAELDRLEALLGNNTTATNVVPLHSAPVKLSAVSLPTSDASKLETESARLRAEVGRLSNEVASKTSLIAMRDAELDRLEGLVVNNDQYAAQRPATAPAGTATVTIADATRFTSEITRLRALVDQTRSELSDKSERLAARESELGKLQGQSGQAAAYIAEHNHLRAEIARLSQQNAALSLDIANYQRVREALQEASRIASKG